MALDFFYYLLPSSNHRPSAGIGSCNYSTVWRNSLHNHRETGCALGMIPLIVNHIYTWYSGYLLGIASSLSKEVWIATYASELCLWPLGHFVYQNASCKYVETLMLQKMLHQLVYKVHYQTSLVSLSRISEPSTPPGIWLTSDLM